MAQRRQQQTRLIQQREAERRQRAYERDAARDHRQHREAEARRRTEQFDPEVAVLRGLLATGCRAPAFRMASMVRPELLEPFDPGTLAHPAPMPRLEQFQQQSSGWTLGSGSRAQAEREAHARYTGALRAGEAEAVVEYFSAALYASTAWPEALPRQVAAVYAFENLVAELFRAMGMEAVTTQRSGEGGVDVEALDPAPIRGGRIVVQVKRYRNTVPPTAVRDLYGTVQDKGANKGVLVTTGVLRAGVVHLRTFDALPGGADRLVLVAAIDPEADPHADLAGFTDARIRLLDAAGSEIGQLEVSDGRAGETALVLGSFRRRANGDWDFVIGGKGYRGGLEDLLREYGVEVA